MNIEMKYVVHWRVLVKWCGRYAIANCMVRCNLSFVVVLFLFPFPLFVYIFTSFSSSVPSSPFYPPPPLPFRLRFRLGHILPLGGTFSHPFSFIPSSASPLLVLLCYSHHVCRTHHHLWCFFSLCCFYCKQCRCSLLLNLFFYLQSPSRLRQLYPLPLSLSWYRHWPCR